MRVTPQRTLVIKHAALVSLLTGFLSGSADSAIIVAVPSVIAESPHHLKLPAPLPWQENSHSLSRIIAPEQSDIV